MVRYTGRQKTITGAVNTNQVGLKMSGCPSRIGKQGKHIRLLGRRVNCMYGLCGPTMVNGAPWRTSGRNFPPYCRQRSTVCAQAAGGVGHINSPYTRTRVPAAGKQGCTQVSTATASTLPSEFTVTLGIDDGDPLYNSTVPDPIGSMSPFSTALLSLTTNGGGAGFQSVVTLFIQQTEGWEEGASVEVTVGASGAISTTVVTLFKCDPACELDENYGEVCCFSLCGKGSPRPQIMCNNWTNTLGLGDTIGLKLLPNANYNIGSLTLVVSPQGSQKMGYVDLLSPAPLDTNPVNLRAVYLAILSWTGLVLPTTAATFSLLLGGIQLVRFSTLQVQLEANPPLHLAVGDANINYDIANNYTEVNWSNITLDLGQEWLNGQSYKLTFLA